jgi:hypothetical protein
MARLSDYSDYYDKSEDTTNVSVSDLFIDIYKNINITEQVDKIKQLSKEELYLMLILCLDKFPDGDVVVTHTLSFFMDEILEIKTFLETKETNNKYLNYLATKTKDDYIDTDNLSYNGELLPEPPTIDEVRDRKLRDININNDEDGK